MYDALDHELVSFGEDPLEGEDDLYELSRSEALMDVLQQQEDCLRLLGFTPDGHGGLVCRGTCGIQLYFDEDHTSSVKIRLPSGSLLHGNFGYTEWWKTEERDDRFTGPVHCIFGMLYRGRGEYQITLYGSPGSWRIDMRRVDGSHTLFRSARLTLTRLLTLTEVKVEKRRRKEGARATRAARLAERKRSRTASRRTRRSLQSEGAPIDDALDDDFPF